MYHSRLGYNNIDCCIFSKLVLIFILLLEVERIFEIYQVIDLTIPYQRVERELVTFVRYRIKKEYMPLN